MSYKAVTTRSFEITAPALTWNINHGLGVYPAVDVYVTIGAEVQKIMPASVTYVDANNCTITFSEPRAGVAVVS